MTLMRWAEFVRHVEAKGATADTPIDAIDCYSPLAGEALAVDTSDGTLLVRTRDDNAAAPCRGPFARLARAVRGAA